MERLTGRGLDREKRQRDAEGGERERQIQRQKDRDTERREREKETEATYSQQVNAPKVGEANLRLKKLQNITAFRV